MALWVSVLLRFLRALLVRTGMTILVVLIRVVPWKSKTCHLSQRSSPTF